MHLEHDLDERQHYHGVGTEAWRWGSNRRNRRSNCRVSGLSMHSSSTAREPLL